MHNLKYWFIVLGIGLLIYLIAFANRYKSAQMESALTSSDLAEIRMALNEFQNQHNSYPATLSELGGIAAHDATNSVSKKPYLYFPRGQSGVLVAQPQPFRTMLWPFGEYQQIGILTNGPIENVYSILAARGQSSISALATNAN